MFSFEGSDRLRAPPLRVLLRAAPKAGFPCGSARFFFQAPWPSKSYLAREFVNVLWKNPDLRLTRKRAAHMAVTSRGRFGAFRDSCSASSMKRVDLGQYLSVLGQVGLILDNLHHSPDNPPNKFLIRDRHVVQPHMLPEGRQRLVDFGWKVCHRELSQMPRGRSKANGLSVVCRARLIRVHLKSTTGALCRQWASDRISGGVPLAA